MRPLTDHCPKPLLEAGGKPLILHHIERLAAAGVRDIVINHAHLGHMIEHALGDGRRFGVRIGYSPEAVALETAGGIRHALWQLDEDPFLVVNGDIYCDLDLSRLLGRAAQLHAQDDLAHLVLVPNPPHHCEGDFALDHGRLRHLPTARLTYAGIGLYRPTLFGALSPGQRAPLGPLLHEAVAQDRISGELHAGYWLDVGTPCRLAALEHHLRR